MIKRIAVEKLIQLANNFKAVAVIGPRQSGKTTLVRHTFQNKPYISLEDIDNATFAKEDPRGFLNQFSHGAILDEAQKVPSLFSYLQGILDNSSRKGLFIITGSNNFTLQENISQSLAGRIAYLTLLPLSVEELKSEKIELPSNQQILTGFYPPIYDQKIPPNDWLPNYIRTYIEKDVRQIKNIGNLNQFERFMALLAGRTGQELNLSSLGVEAGVDYKTIQSWIAVLETSYVIFLLKSHHKNFNKRIVKRPKLYFNDVGLATKLLGIREESQLVNHPLRGALFENMVIADLLKSKLNRGEPNNFYYWRDLTGHEIDLVIDNGDKIIPVEIKATQTVQSSFFKNLNYWRKLSGQEKAIVLYDGKQKQIRSNGNEVWNWREWKI